MKEPSFKDTELYKDFKQINDFKDTIAKEDCMSEETKKAWSVIYSGLCVFGRG